MDGKKDILRQISTPQDLRSLTNGELEQLAAELNRVIIDTVSKNGGHLASSLGVVDLTIALHRVFRTPQDKILWDVGHQTYAHKLLTGRLEQFQTLRQYNGLNGFTHPKESEHDAFISGHAGSALSAAMGFSAANQLSGKDDHVIAVVGDGSLTNGITLEALNNLRSTCRRMIIVLNDNAMSISKTIGALPRSLNRLITGRSYNRFKAFAKTLLHRFPGGSSVVSGIRQLESTAKNLFVPGILFEELEIRYVGPINGHDIPELIRTFESVKEWNRPVLVHVVTEKGHGYEYAKDAPEKFHGIGAFDPVNGKTIASAKRDTFSSAFGKALLSAAEKDDRIVAITAAMASGCGIPETFISRYPNRFFDVGIAEEHALTFAGGLAAAGKRPVVAMYATFLHRGLDCVFHDICLQSLPVVICIDRAGVVEDGPTHHGLYDLSFLLTMPNLSVLMPESETALQKMMELALTMDSPVAIRYPRGNSGAADQEETPPVQWGCAVREGNGTDLAIWTSGRELYTARKIQKILSEQYGISAVLFNARFLKPFDEPALLACAETMPVATLEDHSLRGGLGDIAASLLAEHPERSKGLFRYGWAADQTIIPHGSAVELRAAAGLLPEQIAADLAKKCRNAAE